MRPDKLLTIPQPSRCAKVQVDGAQDGQGVSFPLPARRYTHIDSVLSVRHRGPDWSEQACTYTAGDAIIDIAQVAIGSQTTLVSLAEAMSKIAKY